MNANKLTYLASIYNKLDQQEYSDLDGEYCLDDYNEHFRFCCAFCFYELSKLLHVDNIECPEGLATPDSVEELVFRLNYMRKYCKFNDI